MYKLFGSARSRAGRVMWMLEELGADYQLIDCGPHSSEVLAISPTGKIPALLDGDTAITDSTAILLHLGDKHQKMTFPTGSAERAKMMSIIGFAIDAVEQPLWSFAKHSFVYPEELRAVEAVTPALKHEFVKAMEVLDTMLGDQEFIMGDQFTTPDVILGHLGGWAKGIEFPASEGRVADYMTRIRSRPGWKSVLRARAS